VLAHLLNTSNRTLFLSLGLGRDRGGGCAGGLCSGPVRGLCREGVQGEGRHGRGALCWGAGICVHLGSSV